jgi:mucin-19
VAFEITKQEIIKQAIALNTLWKQTRDQKYRDEELRLRRIALDLENTVIGGGGSGVTQIVAGTGVTISPAGGTGNVTINATATTPDLQDVTDEGNTTTNAITVGGLTVDTNVLVVDSVNDRVVIGATTATNKLEIFGTGTSGGVSSNVGYNIQPVASPVVTGVTYVLQAGTALEIGTYYYRVTYYNAIGETNPSSYIPVITTAGNRIVQLNNIPTSTDASVIGRKIYRSKLTDGSSYGVVIATLANNTTTTYTDSTPDTDPIFSGSVLTRPIWSKANTTARYITVSGTRSMILDPSLTTFGVNAGAAITVAPNVSLFGVSAGQNITYGGGNTLFGAYAGGTITGGFQNVAIGEYALHGVTTGSYNIGIGPHTNNRNNSFSIALGYYTGNATTGNNNIMIGSYIGSSTLTMANSVIIGHNATPLAATNNQINIANTIYGRSNTGNVQIGTTTDAGYKLDVNGTARVSGTIRVGSTFNGTLATLADFRGASDANFVQIARETDTSRGVKIYASGMIIASSVEISGAAYSFLNNGSGSASSGNRLFFNISGGWAPTSGTASWDQVRLNPTINTTGTYAGIVRGIYYNPTLTSTTGVTHRAIETTSGDVIFNGGNVGIGTTTPLRPLHINTNNNDSSLSFRISNEFAAGRAGLSFNLPNNANEFYSIGVDNDRFLKIANSNTLVTNTRVAISPGGNVLIGTTTDAGYKLDVNGTARLNGLTSINGIGVANTAAAIYANGTGAGNFIIQGYDASLNQRFYLTASGNFRINGLTDTGTAGHDEKFRINLQFSPTSGTREHIGLWLVQTINQTGGANGITRGLYINPIITSAADFRAIETTAGKIIHQGLTNTTQSDVVYYNSTTGELTYGAAPSGGSGTVTSITAGTGLSGGTITTSGTIALANTTVTAGSYTLASITVDAQGRITAASSGSAGGTGTVTSVAMTVPTGLSISGSPITTSGTLAITLTAGYSIPTTASQTNWDTAYTNRITSLTTTGNSGAATLVTNTLNIPNYTLAGLGGQPALSGTGFVKISGTTISYDNSTYYLASNPSGYTTNVGTVTSVSGTGTVSGLTLSGTVTSSGSLTLGGTLSLTSGNVTTALGFTPYNATNPAGYTTNTGTVTSVAMSVPTGLVVSGSPITTSGTLAVTFASGYSIPTTANQTNWTTAYNNRIATFTTTGSSGAATFTGNTLNIPNYTLAGLGYTTPTLAQVTTAGNTTTNAITVDKLTINNGTYNASIGFGLINSPTANYFDVFFANNTGLRFGSPSFDGSAFQAFGGLHASYPGQLYFDYGSQQRTVANRSANFRNASSPSPVTVMKLTNTSNVLIGTTTDSGYKLDVNGTIRSNNVITASGGNSTDWNTAFGWGDHAAAGYITGTTGFTGVFTIPTNPPGQQNLDIQNGLIINVF